MINKNEVTEFMRNSCTSTYASVKKGYMAAYFLILKRLDQIPLYHNLITVFRHLRNSYLSGVSA